MMTSWAIVIFFPISLKVTKMKLQLPLMLWKWLLLFFLVFVIFSPFIIETFVTPFDSVSGQHRCNNGCEIKLTFSLSLELVQKSLIAASVEMLIFMLHVQGTESITHPQYRPKKERIPIIISKIFPKHLYPKRNNRNWMINKSKCAEFIKCWWYCTFRGLMSYFWLFCEMTLVLLNFYLLSKILNKQNGIEVLYEKAGQATSPSSNEMLNLSLR